MCLVPRLPAKATGPISAALARAMLEGRAPARVALRLARDEKGNFLVFVGLSFAVFFGLIALSFDLGRMAAVQTDLQSFADSVALAAAAELDGQSDSIERACVAAALVTETQSFASGDRTLTMADLDLAFLNALPAADDSGTEVSGATVATIADPSTTSCAAVDDDDQVEAVLVRVNVDPHDVEMNFASVVSVITGGARVEGHPRATATAGFTQFACDIAPLMFCLPRETDSSGADAGPADLNIGQMVRLRKGGASAAWGPGNFGFLDVSAAYTDTGGACAGISGEANRIRCILGAVETVTRCYSVRGVSTDPGQSVGITVDPFNFRFDIWDNNDSSYRDDLEGDFAPAPNVIYGQEPTLDIRTSGSNVPALRGVNHCSPISDDASTTDFESSMGLPPGAELTVAPTRRFGDYNTAAAAGQGGTFLPGSAERNAYMRLNHNWHATTGNDPFFEQKTRWAVYLEELRRAGTTGSLLPPMRDSTGAEVPLMTTATNNSPSVAVPRRDAQGNPIFVNGEPVYENARQETGRALCAPIVSADPYRRVVVAAAVDCDPVTGTVINGHSTGIPVETFYEFFLTEPVGEPTGGVAGDLDMYGEIIGIAGTTGSSSTSNGIFRDVVQLYR